MSDEYERGDDVMAKLTVTVFRSGAMSVAGNIEDRAYALALIDGARDAVINHHARMANQGGVIMPRHDNPLAH